MPMNSEATTKLRAHLRALIQKDDLLNGKTQKLMESFFGNTEPGYRLLKSVAKTLPHDRPEDHRKKLEDLLKQDSRILDDLLKQLPTKIVEDFAQLRPASQSCVHAMVSTADPDPVAVLLPLEENPAFLSQEKSPLLNLLGGRLPPSLPKLWTRAIPAGQALIAERPIEGSFIIQDASEVFFEGANIGMHLSIHVFYRQ